jgi:hypothetical protein
MYSLSLIVGSKSVPSTRTQVRKLSSILLTDQGERLW